jgi:hypothetical protein
MTTIDYATLQKSILIRLRDGIEAGEPTENLINLVDTAIDYGFYLQDTSGAEVPLNKKASDHE